MEIFLKYSEKEPYHYIAGLLIWEYFRMGYMKYSRKRTIINLGSSNEDAEEKDGENNDSVEKF
jgi:hypothetical protein